MPVLGSQQLSDELSCPLAVVNCHIEMSHRPDHEGAESGHLHPPLCCRNRDRRGRSRAGVDHHDIGLNGIELYRSRNAGRYRLGECACCCMIIGKPLQMMIKGVEAGGGEHAGLAPATAKALPQYAGACDVLRRAHQHRANRSPEALRETHVDGVEEPPVRLERYSGCDMRVPQPGAVKVIPDAMLSTKLAHRRQLRDRLDRPTAKVMGVFDCHRCSGHQVRASRRRNDLGYLGRLQPTSAGRERCAW